MKSLPLEQILAGFKPDAASTRPLTVQKALYLARCLQARATALQTAPEKKQQDELKILEETMDNISDG